ncbi:hypothetical protein ACP70R_020213 [Stipagrostis hirtigluma subsp. patula]
MPLLFPYGGCDSWRSPVHRRVVPMRRSGRRRGGALHASHLHSLLGSVGRMAVAGWLLGAGAVDATGRWQYSPISSVV